MSHRRATVEAQRAETKAWLEKTARERADAQARANRQLGGVARPQSGDRRKQLSWLIAAGQLAGNRIVVPFAADVDPGGLPCRITEVRERSATWVSLLDERKTGTANLDFILVDPAEVEWRRSQPTQREREEPMGINDTPRTCRYCGKTKPAAEFDRAGIYGAYCHECKPIVKAERATAGEKKPAVVATTTASPATATQSDEPHALPIKRSIKAKAARRGKKRKSVRKGAAALAAAGKTGHKNGRPSLTLKELVAGAKRLKSEHAIALKTIDTLQAEKAELYAQLQEILG
jgi:hypothetical protein